MTEQQWMRATTTCDFVEMLWFLHTSACYKLPERHIDIIKQLVLESLDLRMRLEPLYTSARLDSIHIVLRRPDPLSRYFCEQIREIFGNPFRPAKFDPAWRSWHGGLLPHLARSMRREERFQDMPILADALTDAGCEEEEILSHCRQAEPHAPGCWVLGLVLGDEEQAS